MIGREGFGGANQNTECIHDSQWEAVFLSPSIRKAKSVPKWGAGRCLFVKKQKLNQNRGDKIVVKRTNDPYPGYE